jgi:adenylate kinase
MDCFRLHLDCKTSSLFVGNEEQPSDFEWHCEKGIAVNAKKILAEFTGIHKLRPIKILMQSKAENMRFDDILRMISDHYRIPVIT